MKIQVFVKGEIFLSVFFNQKLISKSRSRT